MDFHGGILSTLLLLFLLSIANVSLGITDPNDAKVLNDFRKGLKNPELLKWPINGNDPCGPPSWPHVFCTGGRITQIQVANLGLMGTLPPNFNQLTKLYNVGLQRNYFTGNLPTFSGLSDLQFAYLDFNQFDSIPSDFFHGLNSIRVLALDNNPFNSSTGWTLPDYEMLQDSLQLTNFSCSSCNIVGGLPDFYGNLPSLMSLKLSYNKLSGPIPESFRDLSLQILWLNDQDGGGMTGTIDVIKSMTSLTEVWLHGNQFTGSIPDEIGDLTSLKQLNLNGNKLVGMIPSSLALMDLHLLDLNNNMLMGPIPEFKSVNVSFSSNSFCQKSPGLQCSDEVTSLLQFLREINYPSILASDWSGNDPCQGPWLGVGCNPQGNVSVLNLRKQNVNGTLSSSLGNLHSLMEIHLGENNLSGQVPEKLTHLRMLRMLDISDNNFAPPLPLFPAGVKIIVNGNPLLAADRSLQFPPPKSKSKPEYPIGVLNSTGSAPTLVEQPRPGKSKMKTILILIAAVCSAALILLFVVFYLKKTKKEASKDAIVIHPKESSFGVDDNMVKVSVSKQCIQDGGRLAISVHVLRKVTNNFSSDNEIGRGGFGAVYRGEMEDGTRIAVKRMESGVITNKAFDEFEAEIDVLSKVRHRNLVSLLGYCVEEKEKLLVYEYMPQGALSKHLFRWESFEGMEPLSWTKRLYIALDVARGMEYLHGLAHQSFIHRDLKSSNILLDDKFRAKVSDFGLVKHAPDRERSVVTRLAGTFGYLAPEYAVTGKITTKVDVFSFGVVLMEILTGLVALDEKRVEEKRYLAEWFWKMKSDKEKLMGSLDVVVGGPMNGIEREVIVEEMLVVAELAWHCTARDPIRRPEMGYAVNVLSAMVEKWKPFEGNGEEMMMMMMEVGEDDQYSLPLPELLKGWQELESSRDLTTTTGSFNLEDSKGSIPARPTGFADSFNSNDAR
ncbi:receptor protein kinase TMK1-like [Impatiens glandulifera]|uniref:receptor protein kinase TMK1-like n=1 Tax=Impatiens glandulifera TaxID=253017 RepID=UPI001FB1A1AB|nr:receptor protein kinase TMK1-like [Impatiens glandulifera]